MLFSGDMGAKTKSILYEEELNEEQTCVPFVSLITDRCPSVRTVQPHRHLGQHRPLGGVFHHLLLPMAPHSSGSRHVRRGKHIHTHTHMPS